MVKKYYTLIKNNHVFCRLFILFSLSKYQCHGLTGVIFRVTVCFNYLNLQNEILLLIIYLIITLIFLILIF